MPLSLKIQSCSQKIQEWKRIQSRSDRMWMLSRMGFRTRLNSKKVKIGKEKMSQMIIKGKLSERAVVKEDRLRQVYLQGRRITQKKT